MVNLAMSLIPLVGVLLLTHDLPTRSWALIWFPLVCLFLFSAGMGLLLAAAMVFFRDIQFLWSVISMLWMYLTLYKMNPLFHIIRIARVLLIDGVSPEPRAYLFCIIATVIPLIFGVAIFKKTQDRFVLYL